MAICELCYSTAIEFLSSEQGWSGEGCLWVCLSAHRLSAIENALIALSDSPQFYFFNQILVNQISLPTPTPARSMNSFGARFKHAFMNHIR